MGWRKPRDRKPPRMTTAVKALFAFVLSLALLCQATLASRGEGARSGTSAVRKCCGVNCHACPLKCPSLGCCERGHAPLPASNLPDASNDDRMMAASTTAPPSAVLAFIPRVEGHRFPSVPAVSVPLYQRNCAYLL